MKRITSGLYSYRGYAIGNVSHNATPQWNIAKGGKTLVDCMMDGHDTANTLKDAKSMINRWEA